jgi:hypothetical protein
LFTWENKDISSHYFISYELCKVQRDAKGFLKKKGGGCKGMATAIISQSQIAMDINPTALFIRLIIYLFQLIFLAETVFFSRNKSANSIFLSQQINTTVFYDAHIFC